jgi:hypothetical protein
VTSAGPIEELKRRFNSEAAQNLSATYLLDITGLGQGPWLTRIDMGSLEVIPYEPGSSPEPDCSISVAAEDLEMIMAGKLSAMTAAMSGLLSIDGELGLAMQLVPVFFD